MRKPGILTFFQELINIKIEELVSIKREEQHAENKTALSQTDVILSPLGKSDFSMKQHKVCTFKWALSKIAISDLYLVFSCTVTLIFKSSLFHISNSTKCSFVCFIQVRVLPYYNFLLHSTSLHSNPLPNANSILYHEQ